MRFRTLLRIVVFAVVAGTCAADEIRELAYEVRGKGWIVFCSRAAAGDWDLFLCRPDGSDLHNITRTPQYNEAAPQFSRDGRRLLYRRLSRDQTVSGNRYGEQGQLVFANNDGSAAAVYGTSGEYRWASWGPDGGQIACLSIKGISFVDLASRQVVRTLNRQGFFQQLTWSPDGQWLSGVANSFGTGWSVARMSVETGATNAVSRVNCCTPDWFLDGTQIIFSSRPPGQKGNHGQGWTQLWRADAEGKGRKLVYGEDGRHVYGGHVSPDGKYVLFTGNFREDGDPEHAGAPMGLMRLADAPILGGESKELRALQPEARNGPILTLPIGWEPCWTFTELVSRASSLRFADGTSATHEQGQDALATKEQGRDALATAHGPKDEATNPAKRVTGWQPEAQRSPEPAERVGDGLPSEHERVRNSGSAIPKAGGLEAATQRAPASGTLSKTESGHSTGEPNEPARLADEVRGEGWIVFSAATDSGDWDLLRMRPDGSDRTKITDTRQYNEAGAKFSPDGRRLLYYRMARTDQVDNNTYGTYDLVIANSDGSDPVVYGNNFRWASWGPDSSQIACLDKQGIQIVDLASRKVVRQVPRSGIVQQLVWSPDGKWFVGTANGLGVAWTIGCSDAATGRIQAVSESDRYNCTPDWLPDSEHIIYSRGIVPGKPGWAQLWMAQADGSDRRLLYAEPGRHLYGGCVSPDGRYVLFTRSEVDLGKVDNSRTRMALIRRRDTPMVGGSEESLRREFPDGRQGPVLDLGWGWEPDWIYDL
jgi:Tol biopolymer transport system component